MEHLKRIILETARSISRETGFICVMPSLLSLPLPSVWLPSPTEQRNFHLRSITMTGSLTCSGCQSTTTSVVVRWTRKGTILSNKNHTSHHRRLQLGLPYHGLSYQYLLILYPTLYIHATYYTYSWYQPIMPNVSRKRPKQSNIPQQQEQLHSCSECRQDHSRPVLSLSFLGCSFHENLNKDTLRATAIVFMAQVYGFVWMHMQYLLSVKVYIYVKCMYKYRYGICLHIFVRRYICVYVSILSDLCICTYKEILSK